MQVGILGSFEVRTDDGALADVPGARLRALLIALALGPGRVVPKSVLIDWIWGENPPADAANALQRLASRLRKALPGGVIEGQTGGYRLTVDSDAVDALRFERLVAQARREEGQGRVRRLREASPEAAIAELFMRPPSAPGLTPACHAPDTITDTALQSGRLLAAVPASLRCWTIWRNDSTKLSSR